MAGFQVTLHGRIWVTAEAKRVRRMKFYPCKSCGSLNQGNFNGEVAIHFPGLKNIDKPIVWVFPKVTVCLDCGTAEI